MCDGVMGGTSAIPGVLELSQMHHHHIGSGRGGASGDERDSYGRVRWIGRVQEERVMGRILLKVNHRVVRF
jgi:hypothetical protein